MTGAFIQMCDIVLNFKFYPGSQTVADNECLSLLKL